MIKKTTKRAQEKKLVLSKERLRTLASQELPGVNGGVPDGQCKISNCCETF